MTTPLRITPALLSREDRVVRRLVRDGADDAAALDARFVALETEVRVILAALVAAGIPLPALLDFSQADASGLLTLTGVGGM